MTHKVPEPPNAGGEVELPIPIIGMTCASCVLHVGNALRSVAGVESAEVSLAAETASVKVGETNGASATSLVSAVRDAGYNVSTTSERIHVGGMTSASHVEGHLATCPACCERTSI